MTASNVVHLFRVVSIGDGGVGSVLRGRLVVPGQVGRAPHHLPHTTQLHTSIDTCREVKLKSFAAQKSKFENKKKRRQRKLNIQKLKKVRS